MENFASLGPPLRPRRPHSRRHRDDKARQDFRGLFGHSFRRGAYLADDDKPRARQFTAPPNKTGRNPDLRMKEEPDLRTSIKGAP